MRMRPVSRICAPFGAHAVWLARGRLALRSVRTVTSTLTLFFFALLSVFAINAQAADQERFSVHELSVEGWVLGVLVADFNGDQLNDIAIIYQPTTSQDRRRFVGLFPQSSTSGFSPRPAQLTPLPASASQFQALDSDNDGIAEIAFIDHLGVQVLRMAQGGAFAPAARLARRETVYRASEFRGALLGDFAFELNGAPNPEFVVPTNSGVALYESVNEGGFELLSELRLEAIGAHSPRAFDFFQRRRRAYVIEAPQVVALDGNLDGRQDLYFLWSDRVALFLQDESGAFSRTPDGVATLSDPSFDGTCTPTLADCNGDNRPDLVALRTHGGIAAAESLVDFYLSGPDGLFPARPNKTLALSQARTSLILTDITGDQIPELALPAVELGSVATIKMMMQRKGGLDLLLYPLQNGLPADDATLRRKLNFSLNYNAQYPDQEVLLNWSADYNGDGLKDLAYTDGAGNLKIYDGSRGSYLGDDPSVEVEIANAAELRPVTLNADSRTDLLIERTNSGRINGVWALLSK